ncbi:hypothetical protein HS088_TW23G00988 [Tripterygium wilfordii]|uniref:Bulb-type lectin domain-containing protein n=1 Tax=Tripterygium wilfordii TaxID=458696 RepID=A0A7J7BXG9_TRIWF|nr:hypothetical protein HS088_TW23G00988 [Tripterygium wilfordii]
MINPGFQGSQMSFIDRDGLFLLSNNSDFAFGFYTTSDVTLFLLVVVHMGSSQKVIWSANRGSPVTNSDNFVFDKQGNVFLQKGGSVVWTTNSGGKGVSAMELRDNGNLVLVESDSNVIWQSFDHPTDTLITNQVLKEGMKLVSDPSSNNLSYVLEIKSGDMTLSAAYQDPQPYWSIRKDNRITVNKDGGVVATATIEGNSWRFYDSSGVLLWQFIFVDTNDANGTWIADLGSDGFISFNNLQDGGENGATPTQIPTDPCDAPESCGAYYICSNDKCQCTSALSASGNCSTGIVSPCDRSNDSTQLVNVEDGLGYFALGFVPPSSKTDLDGCKASCVGNCSCLGLFFQNSSGNCFLLDSIGSFKSSDGGSGFVSYIKVLSDGGSGTIDGSKKSFPIVAIIATGTVLLIAGLLYAAFRYYKWKKRLPESPQETSEEDNFLEESSGKSHFPSYAFKMMEEGKLKEIVDIKLKVSADDEESVSRSMKVALWCIQEDMHLRPSMNKVVQMLEAVSPVPLPPMSSPMGSRLFASFSKSTSGEGTASSGPSEWNSDTTLSAVRLSGPR